MAIPTHEECMLPVLRLLADCEESTARELTDAISDNFALTVEERTEMLASQQSSVIRNRVGWARTYLHKAGLVESPRRSYWRITDAGRELLAENPAEITTKLLKRYEGMRDFLSRKRSKCDEAGDEDENREDVLATTPDERLLDAYEELRATLESDILDALKAGSDQFFEQVVIDVLVAMGYGGNREDAAEVLGKSGDRGVDGVIKEDHLGLDVIYVQAKKWANPISRPEIQKFAGALEGFRAKKGVFITTSRFTKEAAEYAAQIESRIVLVDGRELAELMVDHGVGVSTVQTIVLKRVDSDYFVEE